MARRGYHLTEVAHLASTPGDLADEREGWLDDPAVLPSLGPRARALAVASAARSVLGIVPTSGGGSDVTVKPALGPDEGRISAVEWVPLAGEDSEGEAIAVGTDAGWLLFYSLAGDLLHKQNMLQKSLQEVKSRMWKDKFEQEDIGDENSFGRMMMRLCLSWIWPTRYLYDCRQVLP